MNNEYGRSVAHSNANDVINKLMRQRDELLGLVRELLEFSAIASKEITTVRGDFIDWHDKVRDVIAECEIK